MKNKLISFFIMMIVNQSSFATHTLFGNIYNNYTHYNNHYVISGNDDNKWQLIHPYDADKEYHIESATCTKNNCVATGFHELHSIPIQNEPLILFSQDGGVNWSQIKYINGIHTKLSYLKGRFDHVSCYDQRCFASGFVKNEAGNDKTYSLIVSEDSGSTWSILKNENNNNSIAALERRDFYCNQNQCISRSTEDDVFLVSQYMEKNWKQVQLTLPVSKKVIINDLKVSNQNFVAVGRYVTNVDQYRPLIVISSDGGQNWQVKVNDVKVNNQVINHIDNLTCSDNICLASSFNYDHVVSMLSRDSGNTWEEYSTFNKSPEALSMTIKKSICTNHACAMIGRFHLPKGTRPFIASLNVKEKNKKYQVLSGELHRDLVTSDIQCNHSKCYIAGHYDNYPNDGHPYKESPPVLLESDDYLMSWKDISDKDYILGQGDVIHVDAMAISN